MTISHFWCMRQEQMVTRVTRRRGPGHGLTGRFPLNFLRETKMAEGEEGLCTASIRKHAKGSPIASRRARSARSKCGMTGRLQIGENCTDCGACEEVCDARAISPGR